MKPRLVPSLMFLTERMWVPCFALRCPYVSLIPNFLKKYILRYGCDGVKRKMVPFPGQKVAVLILQTLLVPFTHKS
ncbi:hypothetical protein XENTR_v10017074 [Xenopus tropicalis]|nr:hypothetical protein XENTR_v10017074 [Xenopus tropicalis]